MLQEENNDIISYTPDALNSVQESGFYFNEDSKWFEVWWDTRMIEDHPEDIVMIATTQYMYDIDTLFMEALTYWSGRMDNVLDVVTKH